MVVLMPDVTGHEPSIVVDAERMVLGAAMLSVSALDDVIWLDACDFYAEKHVKIWKTLLFCRERFKKTDAIIVAHVARSRIVELGGYEYVVRLPECVPSVECIEHYARIVAESACYRRIKELAGKLTQAETMEEKEVLGMIAALNVESSRLEKIADGLAAGVLSPCHPPTQER